MPRRRKDKTARRGPNPLVVVLVTCAVLLVLLVSGLLFAKSSLQSWLRSDATRQLLAGKAAAALKAEVDLAELKWDGSEVYSDRFVAEGYEEAAFSRLALEGVRARTGGIRDRAFRIPDATVNRFEIEFGPERKPQAAEQPDASGGASGPALPDWLRRYLPDRAEIDEVRLSTATVRVEKEGGEVPFLMSGVQATILPDLRTGLWEIRGRGGKIAVPDQPEIRLKDLGMRWRGSQIFVDRAGLGIFNEGHVDGSGEIDFAEDGQFDLDLEISSIDVDELVDGEWEERLDGVVGGPVRITGRPGAFVYEGTLEVTEATISSMPVLRLVSEYTRNDRFERLVLSQAKTDFRREGDTMHLTNLALQSDGLVRVEGEIDIVAGVLDGRLRVGVAPGTLRWIPGAERQVFLEERDGFLWAPLILAGTVDDPKEDLSARLLAAAGEELLQNLPEGVVDQAKKLLGTDPADGSSGDSLLDRGKPILDLITPFLKAL